MEKEIRKHKTLPENPYTNRYNEDIKCEEYFREHKKSPDSRNRFQQDRDRILYSRAFRRLMHKTQVFVEPKGDHFRTRLTHTLEVAQIARSIARAIDVDEDLTEAIALAHDLGHPPFGHVGEKELDRLLHGGGDNPNGFDHNVQTMRIVTRLEFIGHPFIGLDLTFATLEGLLKHHGVDERKAKGDERKLQSLLPMIKELKPDFDFTKPAGLEAQCASIADGIAYNHHDLEDGLRAELITLDQVCDSLPHIKEAHDSINTRGLDDLRRERRLISDLIGASIRDVIATTKVRLDDHTCSKERVVLSGKQKDRNKNLKKFLHENLYSRNEVVEVGKRSCQILRQLFTKLPENLKDGDAKFRKAYIHEHEISKKRRVLADYIAGMTDSYASRLAEKL